MNTIPIDHCKFVKCKACKGLGYFVTDAESGLFDYCETCGGMGEYLELDYVEDGYEVVEEDECQENEIYMR